MSPQKEFTFVQEVQGVQTSLQQLDKEQASSSLEGT